MTDELNRRLGVWRIVYEHVPIAGKYSTIPTQEQAQDAAIETQLELGMLADAEQVIAEIKRKIDWTQMISTNSPVPFYQVTSAIVDGDMWHTVYINSRYVFEWVKSQDPSLWQYAHNGGPNRVALDLHESLYLMMMLKFKDKI